MTHPETESVIKQLRELSLNTEAHLNEKRAIQMLATGVLHVLFALRDIEAELKKDR